jgi:hypothetical protein
MKNRKRKYDGDYGHKRWPREEPMLQVAMSIEPVGEAKESNGKALKFVFHGAVKMMLSHVFSQLRERLFKDYSITENMMPTIMNGKYYRSMTIQIEQPDFHRLSITEWPLIIKSMLERTFRCEVTYFTDFEEFLNT